jgi:hypothetical protein
LLNLSTQVLHILCDKKQPKSYAKVRIHQGYNAQMFFLNPLQTSKQAQSDIKPEFFTSRYRIKVFFCGKKGMAGEGKH